MKKLLIVLFSIILCVSAFGGGGGQSGQNQGEQLSMFYFGGLNSNATSFTYEDNAYTKKIVDTTGIKLDISAMNTADSATRLNIMLNAGDYPDLIYGRNFSIAEMDYYGTQQGILIPLDQYNIRQYPGIDGIMKEYPALDTVIRGTNGKIYGMPAVNGCLHCVYRSGRAAYYMPFLRDNNRKMFETYDELADYLRWVRDNDINKNGDKNDEIPMMWRNTDTRNAIAFFAKGFMPFILNGDHFGIGLENNKVVEQYRLPEFRDTLRYMAQLYSEKLIAPDSFTMTSDEGRALAYNDPPIVAVYGLAQMNSMMTTNSPEWLQTFIMPVLKGRNNKQYAPNFPSWSQTRNFMSITDKCKNPVTAIKLYETTLSFEMQLDGNLGPKGLAWDYPDAGSISISNGKPTWKQLQIASTGSPLINLQWMNGNWTGWYDAWRYGIQGVDMDNINRWLTTGDPGLLDGLTANGSYNEAHNYIESLKMVPFQIPDSNFIPSHGMSDADGARIADIMVEFNRFIDTSMVEFITGVRNINNDADWNTYNTELTRLGATERATIIQKYMK